MEKCVKHIDLYFTHNNPGFDVNHCDNTLQLQDFIRPDTRSLLYLLDPSGSINNYFFLNHYPLNWNQMENYTKLLNVDLLVVDDADERVQVLLTEFRRTTCPD